MPLKIFVSILTGWSYDNLDPTSSCNAYKDISNQIQMDYGVWRERGSNNFEIFRGILVILYFNYNIKILLSN